VQTAPLDKLLSRTESGEMTEYFNDSPIESPEDDRYGIAPFAQSLAKSILNIHKPVGTTIALNGPWGSGKSSAVNLIRGELKKAGEETLVLTDFKCWWYRGEEALVLAFFQNLNAVLHNKLGDKVKGLIPKLGRGLLQAGPVIGPAVALATTGPWGAFASGSASFAKNFFPDGETLEKTFHKLAKILEQDNRRYLVIIDDIDRLSPDEALAIFRLVKSVGHLPNVMYLLVYDRILADKAVAERYPSEGPHFLEKIIQAGFELPAPLQIDLNAAVLASVEKICGVPDESQIQRLMNNFYDVVVPYIATPRHVARFQNAISVTWPAIAGDVDLADFIALETLRLYEPKLFQSIRSKKTKVCSLRQQGDSDQRDDARFNCFLTGIDEQRQDAAKLALQRLFPRLESVSYTSDFINGWDIDRRVCVEKHFDTYFRLSLSEETLSADRIAKITAHADDRDFVQSLMREAAGVFRKDDSSFVPVYLDELITHASRIEKQKVESLITALFEIHDEIDLECDKSHGLQIANTTLRFHWLIRRLTANRFSIEERTNLYLAATQTASLGWLIDFVRSARNGYQDRENSPKREEDCLTTETAIPILIDRALHSIRAAAADKSLILHKDLISILYRWRDLAGNDVTEVKTWTDSQMKCEEALVILAKKLTRESWSYSIGMFGSLGDRVSTRTFQADIDDDIAILDSQAFRTGLEQIRDSGKLDKDSLDIVIIFLDAWERKKLSVDDW
jgi:predicted KAP-like P-loop ATPase